MQMYKMVGFIFLVLGYAGSVLAQNGCGQQRYLEPGYEVSRIEHIEFAISPAIVIPYVSESLTFNNNLFLDVYIPQNDTVTLRPCIVMNFGGAFEVGWKQFPPLVDYCYAMASRGYVVVSADYRLGFNVLSMESAVRAVYRGGQDMKAAIRWVRAHSSEYGIDPALVFAGGHSAGAINAIHAAYVSEAERESSAMMAPTYGGGIFNSWPDLGCIDCAGNNLSTSSTPAAVINLWGAIGDVSWINSQADAPIISFHGLSDNVVDPYTDDPFDVGLFPPLAGSASIAARCEEVSLLNELYLYPGEGHELWNDAEIADSLVAKSSRFLFVHFLRPDTPIINGDQTPCVGDIVSYSLTPHSGSRYCWNVYGGEVISITDNILTVRWNTAGEGEIRASELDFRGAESLQHITSIDVQALPLAMAGIDLQICAGQLVQIEGVGDGTISWNPSLSLINSNTSMPWAHPLQSTQYQMLVSSPAGCVNTDEMSIAVDNSCLIVQAKLYLEGFYQSGTGLMRTNLSANSVMPLAQPFFVSPFYYSGTETVSALNQIPAYISDWVLVEARDVANPLVVIDRRAGWIKNDGQLWDLDNKAGVKFENIPSGTDFYLVVYHKSHLGIMSAVPISYGDFHIYDFTLSAESAFGTGQLKLIAGTYYYAMNAGDYDSNGVINNLDFNRWISNNSAVNQYYSWDGDGTAVINNLDYNLWFANRSKVGIPAIHL